MSELESPVKIASKEMFQTPSKITNEIFNIPPSPFLKRLGYGTGVNVYKFDRSPRGNSIRSPWALKMINKKVKDTLYGKRLREEASLLKKMNHPNIVGFRAFTKTNLGQECLAMETCSSALSDLIEKRSDDGLAAFPPAQILRMSHHITKALDYLHIRVHLLHGDIKSHNVLIVNDFKVCKLCDFGVSIPLTKTCELDAETAGDNAEYVGTLCWSAPEVLIDPHNVTNKVDIFAFGLVVWEMMALAIPHAAAASVVNETTDSDDDDKFELSLKICSSDLFGQRPGVPYDMLGDGDIEAYNYPLEVFYCCTEKDPEQRPTAHHLALSLYEMINVDKLES